MNEHDWSSAGEMRRQLMAGSISHEELIRTHLDRIHAREPELHAWSTLDEGAALRAARAYDNGRAQAGSSHCQPLRGIPIGIKDVLDTRDLPTAYGSPIYQGHVPRSDSYCVAALKRAGAIILGKNVTAEFAYSDPTPTRNPHDLRYSPGGSSSGSAAAVADGMVPVSISTQTGGSTMRPAAYCGIIGFKPSFGLINRAGLKPLAESFDTLGIMARTLSDVALFLKVLTPLNLHDLPPVSHRPRIAFCRTPWWHELEEGYRSRITQTVDVLARAGCEIQELELTGGLRAQYEDHALILEVEASRALLSEFLRAREQLSDSLVQHIESGMRHDGLPYLQAMQRNRHARSEFEAIMQACEFILTPAAAGTAPRWEQGMGSSLLNRTWSAVGAPCLSLPIGQAQNGMPWGIQLIGARLRDDSLIQWGHWMRRALDANDVAAGSERGVK